MGLLLTVERVREIAQAARRKSPPFIPTEPLEIAQLAAEWERLKAVEEAARSLHAGLTCVRDPMDVDDRIFRLGKELAASSSPTERTADA